MGYWIGTKTFGIHSTIPCVLSNKLINDLKKMSEIVFSWDPNFPKMSPKDKKLVFFKYFVTNTLCTKVQNDVKGSHIRLTSFVQRSHNTLSRAFLSRSL